MIEIFLASEPEKTIETYSSVYQYAKKEKAARDEVNSTMVRTQKSIATAAYICLNSKKYGAKTYSVLFKDFIGLRRAEAHADLP
jgi:hypothetical protein